MSFILASAMSVNDSACDIRDQSSKQREESQQEYVEYYGHEQKDGRRRQPAREGQAVHLDVEEEPAGRVGRIGAPGRVVQEGVVDEKERSIEEPPRAVDFGWTRKERSCGKDIREDNESWQEADEKHGRSIAYGTTCAGKEVWSCGELMVGEGVPAALADEEVVENGDTEKLHGLLDADAVCCTPAFG